MARPVPQILMLLGKLVGEKGEQEKAECKALSNEDGLGEYVIGLI